METANSERHQDPSFILRPRRVHPSMSDEGKHVASTRPPAYLSHLRQLRFPWSSEDCYVCGQIAAWVSLFPTKVRPLGKIGSSAQTLLASFIKDLSRKRSRALNIDAQSALMLCFNRHGTRKAIGTFPTPKYTLRSVKRPTLRGSYPSTLPSHRIYIYYHSSL
ncbi:hypothetical protein GALMADRAFT_422702 [Galerina marginata CBS 339.88]|uniref:Uncharacterized protein n=1 Tax=Galerina marginata (strain CBS 339.88) TaxID=685588 RepID=A0A067TAS9_GALM3|nr:hypothetical protein GALMADRAFT_422702 [Galerina marginata CBS 339.88]